jgi:hypothetical protein
MGVDHVTGRSHGAVTQYTDVENNGENIVLGSATEVNESGNPFTGQATVWVTNIWTELSSATGGMLRIHYTVRVDWPSDINWLVTLVRFKHPGGPLRVNWAGRPLSVCIA